MGMATSRGLSEAEFSGSGIQLTLAWRINGFDHTVPGPLLALSAATCWGTGDFIGGLATRRFGTFRSVLVIFSVGMVALVIVALARAEPLPPPADLVWGALAGLLGLMGIGFLYRGFATGQMGIVAPVSAVLATAIPVIFNVLTAGLPGELQLVGFGVALVGIWLLARPESSGGRPAGFGMAIMAGLGFGGFFIALDQIGESSVFWPLVAGRIAACTALVVLALVTHQSVRLRQFPSYLLVFAGVLDVAGNLFFLLAVQSGRLDVTSVLGSLYPAVTVILARLIIREHLTRQQIFGVGAALGAIVLITL
jgi:drug/metabolite transporter (DMT)-like permease